MQAKTFPFPSIFTKLVERYSKYTPDIKALQYKIKASMTHKHKYYSNGIIDASERRE